MKESEMQKVLKTGTTEGFDRHGHYGEAGTLFYTRVELVMDTEEDVYFVRSILPDEREIIEEPKSQNFNSVDCLFGMLVQAHVPTINRKEKHD